MFISLLIALSAILSVQAETGFADRCDRAKGSVTTAKVQQCFCGGKEFDPYSGYCQFKKAVMPFKVNATTEAKNYGHIDTTELGQQFQQMLDASSVTIEKIKDDETFGSSVRSLYDLHGSTVSFSFYKGTDIYRATCTASESRADVDKHIEFCVSGRDTCKIFKYGKEVTEEFEKDGVLSCTYTKYEEKKGKALQASKISDANQTEKGAASRIGKAAGTTATQKTAK